MKLAVLKIDPDFKNLLPELDAETYTALEKDIVSNGVLDPIIVWHGYITDGHNRYEICKAHRIMEVPTRELNKETKAEVMEWIVDHQFAKRNLARSERIILLTKVEEQIAKEAAERVGGRPRKDEEKPVSNLTQVPDATETGRTAEIMAKKMGVSKNTYTAMKKIVEKGTPEQIKRMDKGGKGNGVSSIAKEIDEGIQDGFRKCKKCGRILPVSEFRDKKHKFSCLDCENKRKRDAEQSRIPQVMPDTLNPDIPIVITAGVVIEEFSNVFKNMEKSLRFSLETNSTHLDDAIKHSIVQMIDDHINRMNALKGEITNETEGEKI